ncbi:MAG: sigma-54 dependent transcriptional regulator [candidate division KSB1 bacterium]|nr:sigma-54 dependent transcriptional regulator [candidate division KSB1 bacterium]MDZ7272956.1 sigma-54 dependent transcriptional regulator [candidate division KSB1 bacterium]MDZ7285060.1 sigma-54 dependent transcriptional regulator [candidate division KSB1 bacterium]MDZ7298092.1 sigma-54 dependent transcriptional regulator [candidate division KSB1 bacterium]MDZ7309528.1 sigma-54 dependent transcriptional regulator [candidate division KSB1 bacterium]
MSEKLKLVIIEDNAAMREGLEQVARRQGHEVTAFERAEDALRALSAAPADLIISDYRLPGMNGLELLEKVRALRPGCEVMVVTAFGSIELAVQAMQKGAADFITKPVSPEELTLKLEHFTQRLGQRRQLESLQEQNRYLRQQEEQQFNFGEIIGQAPVMQDVFRMLQKVAPTDASVIIYGESGTGKELVARAIHKNSSRSEGPFVRVNCGALSETLLESELFGHEKGAFTGALKRKLGRFELAQRGTIFLDEVGDISPNLQVKLLRVLQEKEFERVGGEETVQVDVRVIAATHRNLKEEVAAGRFREDLYYRLHIVPITLPALRQRLEDLPLLADHFLQRLGRELRKPRLRLEPAVLEMMKNYHWPGNVRELENVLERAAVLCEDATITLAEVPPLVKDRGAILSLSEDNLDLNKTLAEVERAMLERALARAHGVKAEAARLLGIKTTTLLYKLGKYGLENAQE